MGILKKLSELILNHLRCTQHFFFVIVTVAVDAVQEKQHFRTNSILKQA